MDEQLLFETKVFFINLFIPGKKKLMVENGRDQPLNGVSIYILRRWDYECNGVLLRKKVNTIILGRILMIPFSALASGRLERRPSRGRS